MSSTMDVDDYDSPPPRRPVRKVPPRAAKIKAPARQTRSTAAYFSAQSSPGEDNSGDSDQVPDRVLRPLMRKRKPRRASTAIAPKRPRLQLQPQPPKRTKRRRPSAVGAVDHVPGVTPPWQTLPYLVWLRVFEYVAEPIRDVASRLEDVTEAIGSLLSAAQSCRATAEPALASLYKCPPFHQPYFTKAPQASFLQFVRILTLPPTDTIIRYRPKVEILRIDTDTFLSRKLGGVQISLKKLAHNLPRLSHLELYHQLDDPPYRELDRRIRWRFSEEDLMQTFEPVADGESNLGDKTTTTQLRSWRWNSRLAPEAFSLDRLRRVHLHPSFASLRKVAYVNYQLPSWGLSARLRDSAELKERDREAVSQFADSISALPRLEHLILESSTLANGYLLSLLPRTLKHLELINCWEIISEDLAEFIATHGSSLCKLTLKHCQSLSLSFLPVLGISCPRLTHLDVDLSYYQHHDSYRDNKPEYASLLEKDQVPTWPTSMQSISIIHMRNWSREAAEMFFRSLVDSAKELPHLRRLEFKVILNIEWRQRQELRKSLVDKMTRIFKKRFQAPKDFRTLRPAKESSKGSSMESSLKDRGGRKSRVVPTRRSTRIADQTSEPSSLEDSSSTTNRIQPAKPLAIGRNLRSLGTRQSIFDADDEDSEDELTAAYTDGGVRLPRRPVRTTRPSPNADEFIHGLCDVVDIQVDNKRPTERQYEMDDFLDSPEESDPEWDGGDIDVFD